MTYGAEAAGEVFAAVGIIWPVAILARMAIVTCVSVWRKLLKFVEGRG